MNEAPPSRPLVRFGVFELDIESGELRKQGVKIRLQEQPFQILQILLERPGQVVTREELQRRIWPSDTFVDFDTGLYNAIKRLREALGDSAESPRFIETLSRRGYRVIAAVEGNGHAATTPALSLGVTKTAFRWNFRHSIALGVGVALVVGAALGVGKFWKPLSSGDTDPQIRSVAVLPLQNLSDDPAQEYFSEGMTDALITDLAQIGSIKVVSRTSTVRYKKTDKSLPEIARELNVDGIIEGTVQRSGNRVRITAQLILGPTDKHLWANSYERDLRDVFSMERDVSADIAHQVRARVANPGQLAHQREINPLALEEYLQGNSHMHRFSRGFGDEELLLAGEYFQRAIDAEPEFAAAYVGLSEARHNTFRSSDEDVEIARKAAERALELDPHLSDAWTVLAGIKCDYWDWAGAEQDYQRALTLNPNDGIAREGLGALLDAQGRMDEGLKEAEIAQQLDPTQDHLEPALNNRHEYDKVIQHITTMLEVDPNNGVLHHKLYEGYAGKGMYKEAIQQLEQGAVLVGLQGTGSEVRQAFAASGYRGAMRKWAEALERLAATNQAFVPINIAIAYASAGDKERAFYWLERAYKGRSHGNGGIAMVYVNRDPGLEPLRSDPRYKDLVRRVGLPQ